MKTEWRRVCVFRSVVDCWQRLLDCVSCALAVRHRLALTRIPTVCFQ